MRQKATRRETWQGMNWIRKEKRLAIYLRDGLACVWCCESIEDGARFTLDHVVPHAKGGSNEAENLVTSCVTCNSSRGLRSVPVFAAKVAGYLDHVVKKADIIAHVHRTRHRAIDVNAAKQLMTNRGNFTKACRRGDIR